MIEPRKVPLPPDTKRDMDSFVGSVAQRVLHNKLVDGLKVARHALESSSNLDDVMRQQGAVKAFRDALNILHENSNQTVKEQFYV